ncbi:MAG TPA: SRPBCC family protein [Beijerinckiaceae bacterium]|jgi:carbon monoxide dehydrogenase subunit G
MQISNAFEVPLPPQQAWTFLLDIQRIAPCMPGAELTEVIDDSTYKGKVSVRLGPVALAFSGTAKFEEIDHDQHRARVKAQGSDIKGRGGASAVVQFRLEPVVDGTKVLIDTDLNLSGAVAQYGRASGMIQNVATQLIGQFAAALRTDIAQSQAASHDGASATASTVPMPAATPIGGFSLVMRAIWDSLRQMFRRATAKG